MTKVRFLFATLTLLLLCSAMQAQFGKRLGKAVEDAAKNATIRKAEQKTDEAVSKSIDKVTDPGTYKDKDGGKNSNEGKGKKSKDVPAGEAAEEYDEDETASATPQQKGVKAAEMAYAKSDFVPGDEIIFEDLLTGEQLGEFPSQWDLVTGNAEISKANGENVIVLLPRDSKIRPFMKDLKNYLPEVYTIEYDIYIFPYKDGNLRRDWWGEYHLDIYDQNGSHKIGIEIQPSDWTKFKPHAGIRKNDGEWARSEYEIPVPVNAWAHVALSVNKRAVKAYLNGIRFCNFPNYGGGGTYMEFYGGSQQEKSELYIRNIRIAKGAVPLYDRMMTDGKIITYGITFDVGKSTIKPESMGEINRIVKLMQDNPDLKFSVEGHTDNTGNATSNQTLSEARSKAVADKLVEMGINKDRLQSAGKGQTSPLADNATDEGRAKNRRVEFVKI
ncbi:MAG: OmpA family protein [Tannerellaceae bacterium]|nr:OmpA family protein [Tannerellaceae bacterium]